MTTILKISRGAEPPRKALDALRASGIAVVEVDSWERASEALRDCKAAMVVCDGEVLDGVDIEMLRSALASLDSDADRKSIPTDVARSLSHELRTPLSAMAGWLHLMESGKLDEAGMKRAIGKLRGNIDDQVRMIERHLGITNRS